MTPLEHYVGQILDDKYRLESLLGQGGMGAVYLATHLWTERYVALKLIAPQFMRNEEFVERFKREARAAGRLRHPNVVDVTDFGFSNSAAQRGVYLGMEFLVSCSLSDVLFEENRLPLYWVVDILEQVCSAVHEAHQQGIVHRDLKPDNIWLEPNGLGGYRIKVLDFGIAKLGETASVDVEHLPASDSAEDTATLVPSSRPIAATAAAAEIGKTIAAPLENLEAATLIHPSTASEEPAEDQADNGDQVTRMFPRARSTVAEARLTALPLSNGGDTGLTRVGAILGTPLYMSPEQCRGEFALYSEYFPKFLKLSFVAHIPLILLTLILAALVIAQPHLSKLVFGISAGLVGVLQIPATLFAAWMISAVTAVLVTQLAAAPLKPVELRTGINVLRQRWRPFLRTGLRVFLRILIGWILFIIPGFVMTIRYMLWSPVVLLEGVQGKPALKRARQLAARSWWTVIIVCIFQLITPSLVNLLMVRLLGISRSVKVGRGIRVTGQFTSLTTIFVMPLMSIVPALLYLKMRQLGGETLTEVMTHIEDAEGTHSEWQQRMRTKLTVTPQSRTPTN